MRRAVGFWPLVVMLVILLLNLIPRSTSHPASLRDIWDAPGLVHPKVLASVENGEVRGVQYGFPFAAYEVWWFRDDCLPPNSGVPLGVFGNLFCLVLLLAAQRAILTWAVKKWPRARI